MLISHKYAKCAGIYKITNVITGKCYIGRTKCFYRRCYQYRKAFKDRNTKHINEYMLKSMIKYGLDNFIFRIIEIADEDVMYERELFWMKYFDSHNTNKGYNLRLDDAGGKMVTHPSTSAKISERLKSEWESGVRKEHSLKLSLSWSTRDRSFQSEVMTKALTKYIYLVKSDHSDEEMTYKELKSNSLHGVLGKFAKTGLDKVDFKGFVIERIKVDGA